METTSLSRGHRAALFMGHCAGMLDLVALPLWMGALIGGFHLDPQRAGGLLTLFLGGQVVSSIVCSWQLQRLNERVVAAVGFLLAGATFAGPVFSSDYLVLAACHLLGGLAAGSALSVTHGAIGRTSNPHRLFALAQFSLALSGVVVMWAGSQALAAGGPQALFGLFVLLVAPAGVVAWFRFPAIPASTAHPASGVKAPLPARAWFAILGMSALTLAQAMMMGFIERIGMGRGYGLVTVSAVLVALSLVNLLPPPLAALLQRRVRPERVVLVGPLVHAGLALLLTRTEGLVWYVVASTMFVGTLVFTHTFLFGLLARLDPSGRAVAATPAMVMIGSCMGPLLGGTLVGAYGYGTLGLAVALTGLLSFCLFARLQFGMAPSALAQPKMV